ncbi:winged helix-turn-helix transcriptional regulator [Hamadaea tsunoensis]|uniref:winged helix-turn-helix transcriptional regulator n=1 Tax=Hamadaea tsunoensis TaxID=53368 RepID=UPI0003F7C391|nr:helix-turn-helix domain-containing protein [Hamadaea tsunoensis]
MSTDGIVVSAQAYRECPVRRVLDRLGDTWTLALLRVLADGVHGFNDLDRRIEGISRRMLTRCLRTLEEEGIVSRRRASAAGGRVEYALTDRGLSLRRQLTALSDWAADDIASES